MRDFLFGFDLLYHLFGVSYILRFMFFFGKVLYYLPTCPMSERKREKGEEKECLKKTI